MTRREERQEKEEYVSCVSICGKCLSTASISKGIDDTAMKAARAVAQFLLQRRQRESYCCILVACPLSQRAVTGFLLEW